jgi:hypothetical protein
MFCILPTTQCACVDFATQRNGGGGHEKDLVIKFFEPPDFHGLVYPQSDMCPSNTQPMTVDHVLTRCPKLTTLMREEIWPNGTDVQKQLFGNCYPIISNTQA